MNDEITRPGGPVREVNGKGRLRCAKVRSGVSTLREIEKTVRRLVDRQILPRCRHLGKVLIPRDAVEKWIVESTRN